MILPTLVFPAVSDLPPSLMHAVPKCVETSWLIRKYWARMKVSIRDDHTTFLLKEPTLNMACFYAVHFPSLEAKQPSLKLKNRPKAYIY